MAKGKKTEQVDESYLDYLGIGGEPPGESGEGEGEGGDRDKVAALLKTVGDLTERIDGLQRERRYPAAPATVAMAAPVEPKLKEVTLDGLPDQVDHPEEYAKGLNTRISETMRDNMRLLSTHQAEVGALATHSAGRSDQLWEDFKEDYLPQLEAGLPEDMDATPYVEVAARGLAEKAVRRGQNLDVYMYQGGFMEDVYDATDKVLAPFRASVDEGGEGEGEGGGGTGPTAAEAEAHRTGGILGSSGAKAPKAPNVEDTGGLISDLTEVQLKSGFY